jgi:hypothetical protein
MARSLQGLAAIALVLSSATASQATPLPPGGSVSGTSAGNQVSTITGTVVAATPFSDAAFFILTGSGPIAGFVSSAAVKTSGPDLDFVYQVIVSGGNVTGVSISSFHNIVTDVTQTADRSGLSGVNQFTAGNVPVTTYTRSGTTGDTISLSFAGAGIGAEQSSFLVIVQTNSQTYTMDTAHINVNNSISGSLNVTAVAPVPEPATFALWGGTFAGFGCCIAGRRRKLHAGAAS